MSMIRLEFVKGGSRKFWVASTAGANLVVQFGRIGTEGQTKTKKCASPAAAQAEATKLTEQKLKKGYVRAGGKPVKTTPVKATPATSGNVAAIQKRLAVVVPAWFEAEQQLGDAIAEEDAVEEEKESIEQALGKPCTAAEIAALEKHLGRPLPASYRAYLSLYGRGKKSFGSPLGPDDHRSKALKDAVRWKSELFGEFQDSNPLEAGAIPFVLDGDSKAMLLFVPPLRKDGDMELVDYDITEEVKRYRDLEAYLRRHMATANEIVAKHAKRKKRGGIQSQRDAIDAVLGGAPAKSALKTIGLRLKGKLADGWVPGEAVIKDLKDRAESERFLALLRGMPVLLGDVAMSIAAGAVTLMGDRDEKDKAAPLVELLFDSAPKKCKPGERVHDWWLGKLNSAIHQSYAAKDFALSAKLSDLAVPHIRESKVIHHNAACAYVAVKRYDDALTMCRVAVETEYAQLDQMKKDKDLGPLLKRPEFKALFKPS